MNANSFSIYEEFPDDSAGLGNPLGYRYALYVNLPDPVGMHDEQIKIWLYASDDTDVFLVGLEEFATGVFPTRRLGVVCNSKEAADELSLMNEGQEGDPIPLDFELVVWAPQPAPTPAPTPAAQ